MKKSIISRKKSKKKQLAAGVLAILLGMFPWTSQSNVFGQTVSLQTTNPDVAATQYANLEALRLAGLGAQPWGETNTITLLSDPTMFTTDTSLTTFLDFAGNTATINRSADVNPNTHLISGAGGGGNFSFIRVLASDFDNHKTLTLNQINVGRFGDTAVSTRAHNITSGALSYNINGTRVVFDGNGNTTADAGAIYIANGTLTLTGGVGQSAFLRNQAQNGGAITAQLAHVNITNTLFGKDSRVANSYGGNTATTDGGAIYIRDNSTATAHSITSSEFYENRARNGAGIYVTAADLALTGGQFGNNTTNVGDQHSNTATGSGGAVYITSGNAFSGANRRPVLTVEGTGFYYNTAGAQGGAIYANNADGALTLGTDGSRTNFRGNTAGTGGGAVYVQNGTTTMLGNLNVSAGTVRDNTTTTGNGGAFFGQYISNVNIDVTNRVQDNEAVTGSGGVFHFTNGTSVNYMMNQLTLDLAGGLEGNDAGINGGVLYGQNIRNATVNTTYTGYNTAGTSGGVFYFDNGADVNRMSTLNITTGTVEYNEATLGSGGVLYAQNASNATVTIGTAQYNEAGMHGGVFYFDNGTTANRQATLNITTGRLERNEANAGSGGVLYAQNAGNVTINLQADVDFNTAAASGGAFYFNNTAGSQLNTLTINNAARQNFDLNTATAGDGGAIRANYIGNATFSNLFFTRNNANANVGRGGALAMLNVTGTIRLDNNTYFGGSTTNTNSAYDGGAVYVSNAGGAALVVDDAHFHTNYATHQGGAIHSLGVTTTIGAGNTGSLFQNNDAEDRGGAIYINTANLTVGNNAGVRTRFLSNWALGNPVTFGGAIAAEAPMFGGWTVDINYADFTTSNAGAVQPIGNYASYGGAIAVQSPSVAFLEIDNSTFTYNNADISGGAVWTQNTLVEITNSVFGSTATDYPTRYLHGNVANGEGGALAIGRSYENTQSNNNFYHTVTDSQFYRNRAHETDTSLMGGVNVIYRGGAIFASQSTLEIRSTVGSGANTTRFDGNVAVHRHTSPGAITGWLNGGGAIAITDDQSSVAAAEYRSGLLINDIVTHPGGVPIASDTMVFENNTAGSGYNNDGTYSLDTAVFRGGGNGGAILATNSSVFKIYNAAFTNNSAFMHHGGGIVTAYGADLGGYGGAIALFRDVQQADPNGVSQPLNAIHQITDSTFGNNSSHYYGGAISAMTLNPGPVPNLGDPNNLIRLRVDGSGLNGANMFDNNRSYVGGAIYANGAHTEVVNAVFNGNSAMKMGDAVYGPADAPYGGAIATDGTRADGTFAGLEGSTLNIVGSTFSGNSAYHVVGPAGAEEARGEGGAVRTNFTVTTIDDTLFQNNSSVSGGALALNKTDNLALVANSTAVPNFNIIQDTDFTANTAYDYTAANQNTTVDVVTRGGAIYVLQTNATISGTAGANHAQFTGNSVVHRVLDRYILDKEAHGGGAIAVSDRQGGGEEAFETKLYVQYADFTNNTAQGQGGAIYAMNALELRITDAVFTANSATAYRTDPGLTSNGGSGGAIAIMRRDEGTLLAGNRNAVIMSQDDNTTFTNNSAAVSGGAISIRDFTQGTVADDFTLSVGADRSDPRPAQTPPRTAFNGNRAGQKGGAIYGYESDVYVYYTDFDSNVAQLNAVDPPSYNEKGGAIAIEGATLTINKDNAGTTVQNSRVTFTNNESNFQGGAIYIGASDNAVLGLLNISGSDFGNAALTDGNVAIQGGAIYLDGPGSATHTIELSTFYDNRATATDTNVGIFGGAIAYLGGAAQDNNANLHVTGTVFEGNSVSYTGPANANLNLIDGGGAIAFYNAGTLTLDHFGNQTLTSFTGNTADGLGGAIHLRNSGAFAIDNIEFTGNEAYRRVGASVVNSLSGSGGAIAVQAGLGATDIARSTFDSNAADWKGGAIYTEGTDLNLNWTGAAAGTGGNTFTGNSAGAGGAVFADLANVVSFRDVYTGNQATGAAADGYVGAGSGGAIAVAGDGATAFELTVLNDRFTRNDATVDGGAVFSHEYYVYIDGSAGTTFNTSAAGRDGGAVAVVNTSNRGAANALQIGDAVNALDVKTTFTTSTAGRHGGAVWASYADTAIYKSIFSASTAGENGGAVGVEYGILNIEDSSFTTSTATAGNGGAVYVWNSPNVSIARTIMTTSTAGQSGGGVYADTVAGNVVIDDVDFTRSTAQAGSGGGMYAANVGGNLTIGASDFATSTAAISGGGVYADSITGNVAVDNTNFNASTATAGSGGGMYAVNVGGNLTVDVAGFTTSVAGQSGGGIYADNVTGNVAIDRTNFTTSTATAGSGGGVYATNVGGNLTLDNGELRTSTAGQSGGGMYADNVTGNVAINRVGFTDSTATAGSGGGVYATNVGGDLTLDTADLRNSTAGQSGGGVFADGVTGNVAINGSNFTTSEATAGSGGGVYAANVGGNLTIADGVLQTNTAGLSGGGVFAENVTGNVAIDTVNFIDSTATAGSGGGVYADNVGGNLTIADGVLQTNTAGLSGGGVYADNVTGDVAIDTVNFTDSMATAGSGGGVYADNVGGNLTIADGVLQTNTAGQSGGGVFAENVTGNVAINTVNFTDSTATAGSGGGVYAVNVGGNLTLDDVELRTNTAGQSGGAVFAENVTGNVVIDGAIVANSTAGASGGAVYVDGSQNVEITNTNFTDGMAAQDGGTVYAANVANGVTIADTNITRSEATNGSGGSVYIENAPTVNIDTVNFRNSSAGGDGGTLYVTGADRIDIADSSFGTNNNNGSTAGGSGGAIYVAGQGTVLNIATTTNFIGNTAGADGGALALVDDGVSGTLSTLQIAAGGTFRNNTAGGQGGAIYLRNTLGGSGVNQAVFNGNRAVGNGGAVSIERDATTLAAGAQSYTFTDSNFTSNNSTGGLGGAISVINDSGATTNLVINAVNRNVVFEGNTDSRGDNDIYVRGVDTYFNAAQDPVNPDEGYKISLNGGIDSDATIYKDGAGILAIYANSNGAALDVREGELIIGGNRPGDESNVPGKTLTISGQSTLRDGTTLSVGVYDNYRVVDGQQEDSALRTGSFVAEYGSTINVNAFHHVVQPPLTGEDWADPARNPIYTLVEADEEINKEGTYQFVVTGMDDSGGDYLRTYLWFAERKTEDNKNKIQLGAGLVWFNTGDNSAHGTFCIAPGETFTISGLYDNLEAVNGAAGYTYTDPDSGEIVTWDGKTLTKDCLGTLILEGTNDYTGDTIIKRGTLIAAHAENGVIVSVGRPSTGEIDVWNGATFQIGQEEKKIAGTLDKRVTGGGDVILYAAEDGAITFTNNANDYTGTTRIMSGTGKITAINAFGDATDTTQSVVVAGGAIFEVATGGTFSQLIDGQGSVLKSGNDTLVLNNGNTYLGGTTVTGGKLVASHVSATGIVDAVGQGPVQVDPGTFLELDTVAGNGKAEFQNTVTGQGGLIVNVGNGNEMTLSSSQSDYTGLTDIQTGNARLTHVNGTGANTAETTVQIAGGAGLQFDFGRAAGENTTYRKNITGAGEMIKSGVDTVTLTNDNRNFTGETTVENGRLIAKHINAVGSGDVHVVSPTSTFEIAAGGVFDNNIDGAGNFDINPGRDQMTEITSANTYTGKTNILSGTGKLSNLEGFGDSSDKGQELTIALDATAEFAVGGTFSQLVSGQGQVVLSGNNTLTFDNANTYRGGTTVTDNGRIVADHATDGRVDALGSGTVNLTQAGSTLTVAEAGQFTNLVEGDGKVEIDLDGADEWSILTGNNTYTGRTDILNGNLEVRNISGTGAQNGAIVDIADGSILRFNTTGRNDTYIKTITGGGMVEKIGSNTVILDGENTYSGGTDVKEGMLVAKNVKAVGDNRVLVSKDATFEIADGSPAGKVFANLVTGDGNFSVDAGAGNVLVLDRVNDYKGDTILKSGTARLRNIDGTGENVAGTKTIVKMQGGALEFDLGGDVGDSATYYKTIQGSGKLIKSGVDEVVINAANGNFTGETIVNNGRLVAAHATGNMVDSFGGTTVDLRSKDATVVIAKKGEFANVVSGSGQLEVNLENAGEWSILSGTSSYTGRTDVKKGNVELTNIFGTGAQNGAIVDLADGSTLRFNTKGAEDTYVKKITGAGGVEKIGLNTVILDGVNTYEDGTAVNVGKLVAKNVQAVGSGDVDVAKNATFAVSATGEFDNLIHGAGNVEFGAGGSSEVLTVTGENDYSGLTTITRGTVSLDETLNATGLNVSDAKSGVEILSGATLDLATGGDYRKMISGAGTLRKSTAETVTLYGDNSHALTNLERGRTNIATATALGGKAVMSNDTTLGILQDLNGKTVATDIDLRGSATLAVDASRVTMSGLFSGVGPLVKNGNGTLKLTNVNNSFTGLNIDKGRVVVENQSALGRGEITNLSELELIVGGTQNLRTDIKSRNGTFIKSGSGRLNIGEQNFRTDKFVMNEGALGVQLSVGDKYFVQADADNGFTVANGSELIGMYSGANGVNRGENNATKFLALRGAGSGNFSKYTFESDLSTVNWKTLQAGNDLYYALWLDSYTHSYDGKLSYNAEQAADGLDRLPLDNPLVQAVNSLTSDEDMIRAFSELHGEVYMSSLFATVDLQRNFNELLIDRRLRCEECRHFKGFRGQESRRGSSKRELWASFTGGGNYRSSMDKFSDYEIGRWGVVAGLEQLFAPGFFAGVALGYDDANLKLSDLPSKDHFYAFRVSTYLNYTVQDWSVLGYFGYAKNWHDAERNIEFLDARTRNKYDDDVITTGFELGRMVHWRTYNLSPVIGLNYVSAKTPYTVETGAGPASLHVQGKRYSSLRMPIGMRATSDFKFREVNIRPELRAFYIPEFLDSKVRGVTAYATDPTNTFLVDSGVKGRNGFRLGLGAQSWFFDCWSIGIDYDIELWQKYTRHDIGANVTIRW